MMPSLTGPFDQLSLPDTDSHDLRMTLAGYGLGGWVTTPRLDERQQVCTDALDLITSLLLLRRALIVLMQSAGVEALAVPFTALVQASLVPLRVIHDPASLPDVLQFLRPGAGRVRSDAPTPGAGYDSDGGSEADRLRAVLQQLRQDIQNDAGRDTLLARLDAALRT